MQNSELEVKWHHLLFGIRRSIIYHRKRSTFFQQWNSIFSILTLISSTSVVAAIISKFDENISLSLSFVTVSITVIDIVINTSKKAMGYSSLDREFCVLESEMIETKVSEKNYINLLVKRKEIELKEPEHFRVLNVICHNELVRLEGHDESHMVNISFLQRFLSDYIDFQPHKLKKGN